VVGHKGWSKNPDSSAKYAIAVSFEIVGREIPTYESIRVEVLRLQAELEVEESVTVQSSLVRFCDAFSIQKTNNEAPLLRW
jgi:hypothetical protein